MLRTSAAELLQRAALFILTVCDHFAPESLLKVESTKWVTANKVATSDIS